MTDGLQQQLAIAFLIAVGIAAVLLMLRASRRPKLTFSQWFFWWIAVFLVKVRWRCKAPPHFDVPTDGRGLVIICNHRSSIDPLFIQVLSDQVIHWMVAKEFVEHPLFGFVLRRCHAIPVNRGGVDNAATRAAIYHAEGGGYVGMFPEGRINETDDLLLSVRPGAILVALKANAWILPAYIRNSPYDGTAWSPLLMTARAEVSFGELIDVGEYEDQQRDAQVIRDLLLRCVGEIAKLAGEPEFRVEVAGRKWRDRSAEQQDS